MFLAPVAGQYRMTKPIPANTKYNHDKKCGADKLRHDRNMQGGDQIVMIRDLSHDERCDRHGEQIYK